MTGPKVKNKSISLKLNTKMEHIEEPLCFIFFAEIRNIGIFTFVQTIKFVQKYL